MLLEHEAAAQLLSLHPQKSSTGSGTTTVTLPNTKLGTQPTFTEEQFEAFKGVFMPLRWRYTGYNGQTRNVISYHTIYSYILIESVMM